ncbi:MAG: T9SS type A sorting domain-containing protein [Ignavibacteriaceae bacterium]|nr:T9SS type A sorting domain-containing protein [Ignavibacteriaceae bacterium]
MPVSVTAQYYHVSTAPILIPVELTSFTAEFTEDGIILNWQTATETNNQGFEIQRKTIDKENVGEWLSIGFIVGKGTTTEPQFYEYSDDVSELITRSFVYRLKQIDFDGSFVYSKEVTVENASLPDRYTLMQNYPNPFNPSTKIKFTIPSVIASGAKQTQIVSLKVYDILGNEVATLVNEELSPGEYEVEFNASSFKHFPSSGIYFYTINAGEFVQSKKMVLLK